MVIMVSAIFYLFVSMIWSQRTWADAADHEIRDRGLRNEYNISHHERRISELERLDIAQRVSKLEAYAESNRQLLIGVTLAVAVMGVESLGRLLGSHVARKPP
jgi:hypothetical protein